MHGIKKRSRGDISESAPLSSMKSQVASLLKVALCSAGNRCIGVVSSLSKQHRGVRVACRNQVIEPRRTPAPPPRSRLPFRHISIHCRVPIRFLLPQDPVRRLSKVASHRPEADLTAAMIPKLLSLLPYKGILPKHLSYPGQGDCSGFS